MTKKITITIEDEKGATGRCEFSLPTGTGQVTAVNWAEAMQDAIVPLITGKIVACSITDIIPLTSDVLEATLTPGADVEEGALFIFRTEEGNTTKVRIPTMAEDYMLSGTKAVDLTFEQVDTFVDLMLDGIEDIVNGDALPSDYRDEDIVSLSSAKENFRPRKGD